MVNTWSSIGLTFGDDQDSGHLLNPFQYDYEYNYKYKYKLGTGFTFGDDWDTCHLHLDPLSPL